MSDRIRKKGMVRRLAQRLDADEDAAEACLDAVLEVHYEAIKNGESITLPDFGGFYVRVGRFSWTFRFNPAQRLRALFRWSSAYKGSL